MMAEEKKIPEEEEALTKTDSIKIETETTEENVANPSETGNGKEEETGIKVENQSPKSTTSTDKLLNSSGPGSASKTSIGAHVLHSIPPRTNPKVHRSNQQQSATSSKHGKYDRVPTREIDSFNKSYEFNNRKRGKVPKFYTVIPQSTETKDEMGIDSQSQMKQNMSQIFSMEEPMKPNKDLFGKAEHEGKETTGSKTSFWPQVLAAVSVSMGSMIVGFVSAYTSPATVSMKNLESEYFPISEDAVSWIGGIMPLAALVGGIIGGPLIDYLGRKAIILHTALPFILASLLIACAADISHVFAGRAITGLCVGILTLVLPVYLGETVQPEIRGSLGLLPTVFGNTGILLCFLAGKYLNWWELAFLGAAIPVPFLILMIITPETPMWYFSKGHPEKARESLQKLRGKSADVTFEYQEIERVVIANKKEGSKSVLKDLLSPSCLKPLFILIGLMFFQQMSGINAVIFYTVTIFKDAGSTIDENLCTIVVGIVNFVSTFLATLVIDKAGRKILLYVSNVSMIVTLGTLGTFFYYKNSGEDVSDFGWLPLVSFVIYVVGFSLGFGPIPWLMMGELLPAKVRGSAASVTTAFNWMCTFIVTKSFVNIIGILGNHGAFWMFCGICCLGLFFVYFVVPETRGKSLEDIERKFASPRRRRRLSGMASLQPSPLSV